MVAIRIASNQASYIGTSRHLTFGKLAARHLVHPGLNHRFLSYQYLRARDACTSSRTHRKESYRIDA